MLHSDDSDELEANRICCGCVGESYPLPKRSTGLATAGVPIARPTRCWAVEDLADRIETAIPKHHHPAPPTSRQQRQRSLLSLGVGLRWRNVTAVSR